MEASFTLELSLDWRIQRLSARSSVGAERQSVDLWRDETQGWTDSGGPRPDLLGCCDVVIAWTPFTNTLPIRRLRLPPGQQQEIRVVYVAVPDLTVRSVRQRYTHRAEGRWFYESLESGYTAELTVDEEGLVVEYPALFRRIAVHRT